MPVAATLCGLLRETVANQRKYTNSAIHGGTRKQQETLPSPSNNVLMRCNLLLHSNLYIILEITQKSVIVQSSLLLHFAFRLDFSNDICFARGSV